MTMKKVISTIVIVLAIGALLVFIKTVKVPSVSSHSKAQTSTPAKKPLSPSASSLLARAQSFIKEGKLLAARRILKEALKSSWKTEEIKKLQKKIEDLNLKIIFSPLIDENSFLYEVKSGDSLAKIAKKFHTTIELIKKSNRLKSDIIRVGQKLKIVKGAFSLLIDKSQNLLFLKENGEIIKTYVVSTGKNNSTPVGTFKIVNKLRNPVWFRKDIGAVVPPNSPQNVLGSRWLGLNIDGYGIHGTTSPQDLGKQVTAGCVRLSNKDIKELFDLLPRGTKVVIMD